MGALLLKGATTAFGGGMRHLLLHAGIEILRGHTLAYDPLASIGRNPTMIALRTQQGGRRSIDIIRGVVSSN